MPPLLIRLRGFRGTLPRSVQVSVQWFPGDKREAKLLYVVNGMVLIPWFDGCERAKVSLVADDQCAELEIEAKAHVYGDVVDVKFRDRVNAA